MDMIPFLTEKLGWVAAVAVTLNIVLLGCFISLGKWFANHVLSEMKEIKKLLGSETQRFNARQSDHGERIARLEAGRHSNGAFRH